MNELIEKYFSGITSLEEEKELKNYFLKGKVKQEHLPYRAMFVAFDEEQNEMAPSGLKIKLPLRKTKKGFRIQILTYSGIAAALMLTLWVVRPVSDDDYAIIRGKRMDNPEFAQQYAQAKINKVNKVLVKSMKPMQSLEIVRNNLKPMYKLTETKVRIKELKEKLQ